MNEEELKKGCGKEFYTHDRIILVKCGTECKHDKRKFNQIHLCPTCQARLEGFQKGKQEAQKMFLEEIDNRLDWINNCLEKKLTQQEIKDFHIRKYELEKLKLKIGEEK